MLRFYMSFVKSVFDFMEDFVLGAQIMMCPKAVCSSHNRSEIPLLYLPKYLFIFCYILSNIHIGKQTLG